MYKIGITGSIGMGKSTIAKMFSILGIPVHDSDHEVQKLLRKKEVLSKINKKWPGTVENNTLNKKSLRNKIFKNKSDKEYLEKIIHPLVKGVKAEFERRHCNSKILVYDVPLIFETNTQRLYDMIILANCSEDMQKLRVLKRKSLNESMFNKIKQNQLSFDSKLKFNPLVINTMKSKAHTFLRVISIILKVRLSN